jgi:hypothetical protein
LGADAKPMNTNELIRVAIEQMIVKSGIPPSFFGLSWSSTERMASEQAEHLLSLIDADRMKAQPVISRLIETAMILNGFAGRPYKITWPTVNLKDEEKQANARLANANAAGKELESRLQLFELGMLPADDLIEYALEQGMITEKMLQTYGKEKTVIEMQKRYERKAGAQMIKAMMDE